jgi:stage II sporulation protein D
MAVRIFLIIQLIALLILYFGCSSSRKFTVNEDDTSKGIIIRVLIEEKINQTAFDINNSLYLRNDQKTIAIIYAGSRVKITLKNNLLKFQIDDRDFSSPNFEMQPVDRNEIIQINNKRFRGSLKIVKQGDAIFIINYLPLEEYLKGVIPAEMPLGRDNEYYEALKAFTICARTYALIKLKEQKEFFDVYSDTRDQVYGGAAIEASISNRAAIETKDIILMFGDKPAITFYHSTCGGTTEDVKNVFSDEGLPYLMSHDDGDEPYCSISPNFYWEENYKLQEFTNRLFTAGLIDDNNVTIHSLQVMSRFPSGRINELRIIFQRQSGLDSLSIFGNNIRFVIRNTSNTGILKSNNFEIKFVSDDKITLSGKGYGHGVGMCQWGALALSIRGIKYQEILNHYYPGTHLRRITHHGPI